MRLSSLRMGSLLLNNYERVLSGKYLGKIPVDVYKSRRTGLHVALANAPGPVVNCHMVLATEVETDDGLPHTLEHLTFMGSRSFPFKGALDLLSFKVFSVGGTNAWTDQDHTSYTLKTIGATGMQKFIPIYGDHLLNPLLTPANYESEVYHVNKNGEEAGVVYSEIQDNENDLDNLVDNKRKHLTFPNHPSLCSDAGGRMKAVRELCSLKRVQDYHKKYYHLRNMWILLCGNINSEEMLKSIEILDSAEYNRPPTEFTRPFIDMKVPDIVHHRLKSTIVKGPSEHVEEGIVQIGFLSKPAWDLEFMQVVEVLSSYLTETASAPLMKELVLCNEPYCDSVSMSVVEMPRNQILVYFSAVPTGKLDQVADKFFDVLRASTTPDKLDLERIKYIIQFRIKKLHAKLEKGISDLVFNQLIGYQLFSRCLNDQNQFDMLMNPIEILNGLKDKPAGYWSDIVAEIFKDNCVVIIGKPDATMGKEIAVSEQKRLKELKDKAEAEVAKRIRLDSSPTNDDASNCAALTTFENINFDPNVEIFKVHSSVLPAFVAKQLPHSNYPDLISNLPFTTIIHDMDTRFLRAYLLFDLKAVPLELKKYLMLFDSLLSKSAATVDGRYLSDVEVANLMVKELMECTFGPGFLQLYKRYYSFYIEVANNEFHLFPKWAKIFLSNIIFEKEKILALAKNLAQGASSTKRNGYEMGTVVLRSLSTVKGHEERFYSDIVLENFHRELAKSLEGPDKENVARKVIEDLERLRRAILKAPANLHMICNQKELAATSPVPSDAWDFLDPQKEGRSPAGKITTNLNDDVRVYKQKQNGSNRVLTLDSCDASYLMSECPVDIEFGSPEHISVLIMSNYFSVTEGVLWKCIRGNGYAYGAWINFSVDYETLNWDLYRCARPKLAYQTMKNSVLTLFNGKKMDPALFDLAKRSSISSLISRYETMKGTARLSAFDNFRGRNTADILKLANNIWTANESQVFELSKPFFVKIFDESKGVRSVICPRIKLDEVKETFPEIEVIKVTDLQYTPE